MGMLATGTCHYSENQVFGCVTIQDMSLNEMCFCSRLYGNLILSIKCTYPIISILVPPMFWIPNQLEGAYVGQDVTLECHSEAFPPSINYWEKEDGHTLVSGKT